MVHQPHGVKPPHALGGWVFCSPRRDRSRRGRGRDDDGLSMVLLGLLMVPLLIITAFAVDLGAARSWRRQSQNSADTGALAGAIATATAPNAQAIRNEAGKVTARNMLAQQSLAPTAGANFVSASGTCPGTIPIVTPTNSTSTCYTASSGGTTVFVAVANPYDHNLLPTANTLSDAKLVWVRACKVQPNAIAGVINQPSINMCTESVARNTQALDGPVLYAASKSCPALTLMGTIHVQNNDGTQGGLVATGANCSQGIDQQGGSLYAGSLEAPNGSANVSGSSIYTNSATVAGLAPDPYAWLPNPVIEKNAGRLNCDPDPTRASGCNTAPPPSGGTYSPGVYTGQMNLNGKNAVLRPGIYYLMGGFSMDASSTVTVPNGGVLFVNVGGNVQLDMAQSGSRIVSTSYNFGPGSPWPCTTPPTNCPRDQNTVSTINPGTGLATNNPWAAAQLTVYQPSTNNQNMSFGSAPGNGLYWQGGIYLQPGYGNTAKIQLPSTNGMNVVLHDARLVATEIQWNDNNANYTIISPASQSTNNGDMGLEK